MAAVVVLESQPEDSGLSRWCTAGPNSRSLNRSGDHNLSKSTYKPQPVYTDDARNMKLEGEVLLEVSFGANGTLHVNRVVRGLGHGLDEAADRGGQQDALQTSGCAWASPSIPRQWCTCVFSWHTD